LHLVDVENCVPFSVTLKASSSKRTESVDTDRKYLSYLLRLWTVEEEGGSAWRASLEATHSGERYGFASLESLLTFLKEQTQTSGEGGMTQKGSSDG
jgi:hypothetical protein